MLLAREIGSLESIGSGYIAMGWISLLQGNTDSALQSFQQAEKTFDELGDPMMIAWDYWNIAQVYVMRGELDTARKKHEEALRIREQAALKGFAAESRAALADIALEQQEPARAESMARSAVQQFALESQTDNEAWALALLAQSLAAQGKQAEAREAVERARRLTEDCQNLSVRLFVTRTYASMTVNRAQKNSRDSAQRELAALLTAASAAGFVTEEFQIRLALHNISFEEDHGKEAADKILTFSREATKKGFWLIAKKARDIAKSSFK